MTDVLTVLQEIGHGFGIQEIAGEFETVLDSVRVNGGAGEITIKLKLEGKAWHPDTNQLLELAVTHTVSSKRPKRKVGASTFFVARDGSLSRENRNQMAMFDMTEVKDGKR